MSKNKFQNSYNDDWKSKLRAINNQMISEMTPEKKMQRQKEKLEKEYRRKERNKRKEKLYQFLAGYKQNSGIFVNNFFRKRDYKTYCQDKWSDFTINFWGGILPNIFDDPSFSWAMVGVLNRLEDAHLAYFPIDYPYIDWLINFAEFLDLSDSLEEDMIVYRGCTNLERNGVNGIVSTTSDYKIAEQFSRGTILKIHVPKGTKYLDVASIRPENNQYKRKRIELEKEFLLPPCDYQILSEKELKKGEEPNNYTGKTRLIEVSVTPLDLLEEFLKILEQPPKEYEKVYQTQRPGSYEEAVWYLRDYLAKRSKKDYNLQRNKSFKN